MAQKRPRVRIQRVYSLIGSRIKSIREKNKILQEDLAKLASLTRPSIVLIETGRQRLPIDRLYNIARALHVSPNRLLPDIHQVFDASSVTDSATAPLFIHGDDDLKPTAEKQIRERLKEIQSEEGKK